MGLTASEERLLRKLLKKSKEREIQLTKEESKRISSKLSESNGGPLVISKQSSVLMIYNSIESFNNAANADKAKHMVETKNNNTQT